ncbi:DUF4240 domain-containing protein [Kitasatospora nipponensis]
MDIEQFWQLIEDARALVPDPADGEAVVEAAVELLTGRPAATIVAAQQRLWDVLTHSYRSPLWAAGYLVNGGCSDDGFDYFRGWLLTCGSEIAERAVADPDSLADLPVVRAAAADGAELECQDALGIAWRAHLAATGAQLPAGAFTVRYPALDPRWDFDFDDSAEMSRRLPRLAALFLT